MKRYFDKIKMIDLVEEREYVNLLRKRQKEDKKGDVGGFN